MPHPHDRPDTLLVELRTIDTRVPVDEPGRAQTTREWITARNLVIHRKKLHVCFDGELYEVSRMRQSFGGLTGIDYWTASRWICGEEGVAHGQPQPN